MTDLIAYHATDPARREASLGLTHSGLSRLAAGIHAAMLAADSAGWWVEAGEYRRMCAVLTDAARRLQDDLERFDLCRPNGAPITPRQVLIAAARLIEEYGHCQGSAAVTVDGDPCSAHDAAAAAYCITGATRRIAASTGASRECTAAALGYLSRATGAAGRVDIETTAQWNDAPDRSEASAANILRTAAYHAREWDRAAA